MCYILYGALYSDIDQNVYSKIADKYEFKFRLGTKHDVKMSVKNQSDQYNVTGWGCDCDSALGMNEINNEELDQYEALFNEIMNLDTDSHIYLCKTWTGKQNKKEIKLKMDEINLRETLATLEVNCLYTFEIKKNR